MSEPITLAIDAATYVGTVAVMRGSALVAARETTMRGVHEERLMPAVAAALDDCGATAADVERVVCGAGPGSFTSLRIAASIAKGMSFACGAPLYARSSLWLIAAGAEPPLAPGSYLAMLDAMRGEWYVLPLRVGADGRVESTGDLHLVSEADARAMAASARATMLGPGREIDARPHARGIARDLARLLEDGPVDLSSWEPDYGRPAEAQARWEAAHGRALPR
jgi:tRNA threonylcarbamoyladenosine biosynthesis protein TsaB